MKIYWSHHKHLLVGFFVFSAVVIFIMGVTLFLTSEGVFNPQYRLVTIFDTGIGLRKGTAVLYNGVRVGSVHKVSLLPARKGIQDQSQVALVIQVDENYRSFITAASVAYVMRDKNLVSDRVINIETEHLSPRVLKSGDTLQTSRTRDVETVLASLSTLIDQVDRLAGNVERVVARVQDTTTTVGAMLGSDAMYTLLMKNLSDLSTSIRQGEEILTQVQTMGGEVGASLPLLMSRLDSTVQGFSKTGGDVQELLGNVNGVTRQVSELLENVDLVVTEGQSELYQAGHLIRALSDFWFVRSKIEEQKNTEFPLLPTNMGPH